MQKDVAVKLDNISKKYKLFDNPIDRLKESLHPFKKKYHKNFYTLQNINFEIEKGEVLGVLGVNGAGKSTLLKIIAGVLAPTSGQVSVNGKVSAILELSSGLKGEMTGIENIKLNLQINSMCNDIGKVIKEVVDFADIGEHINHPVKTYSSGMKARLGFSIATSINPDILVIDEVLAVGDVLFQRKCYSRIEKLFKDGKTVIFVSHSPQLIVEFCSHAILLYDSEIILEGDPKKVTDFYQKLIFSNNKKMVLDEINQGLFAKNHKDQELKKRGMQKDKEFYLSSLRSNPIEYRNHDVDLFDLQILNKHNKQVNILESGQRYKVTYKVKFNQNYEMVRCGFSILTIKGLVVFGIRSKHELNTENKTYLFESYFENILGEGDYFINIGVKSEINDDRIFLNRLVNAYVFKNIVQDRINWGLVYQNRHPTIRGLNEV